MKAADADDAFLEELGSAGFELEELTVSTALDTVVSFYRERRFEDVSLDDDGDMLLCEWGFSAEEDELVVAFVRQLRTTGDDGELRQLRLALVFELIDAIADAKPGHTEWCFHPDDADDLRGAVREEPWFEELEEIEPSDVSLDYDDAE